MAEAVKQQTQVPSTTSSRKPIDWQALAPRAFDHEDSMNADQVKRVWAGMITRAGFSALSEQEQAAFRLGVYAYACANGTSREGNYAGTITLADGKRFDAAVIPLATGRNTIRKFFRGTMDESYYALKHSGVMESDARFIAKMQSHGIPADAAFVCADWFGDCPYMTPQEARCHASMFRFGVRRARNNRSGQSLEEVESTRVDEELAAQINHDIQGSRVEF